MTQYTLNISLLALYLDFYKFHSHVNCWLMNYLHYMLWFQVIWHEKRSMRDDVFICLDVGQSIITKCFILNPDYKFQIIKFQDFERKLVVLLAVVWYTIDHHKSFVYRFTSFISKYLYLTVFYIKLCYI